MLTWGRSCARTLEALVHGCVPRKAGFVHLTPRQYNTITNTVAAMKIHLRRVICNWFNPEGGVCQTLAPRQM
jgi:hypothetical protein